MEHRHWFEASSLLKNISKFGVKIKDRHIDQKMDREEMLLKLEMYLNLIFVRSSRPKLGSRYTHYKFYLPELVLGNAGKLKYTDISLPKNGKTASVMKVTATKAGASGFTMQMDALDLSNYDVLQLTYCLRATSLKFKIVSPGTSKETGDISGLPNNAGWNFFQVCFGGLGSLDSTKVF